MRFLDVASIHGWLEQSALIDAAGKVDLSALSGPIDFAIPSDTGRKTYLANVIADQFRSDGDGLLWIDEIGIWPTCENWTIYRAIRSLAGDSRDLHEAPGHEFGRQDIDILDAMIAVTLYFSWGALLIRGDRKLIARISHDEYISVFGYEEALMNVEQHLTKRKYVKLPLKPNSAHS
jgi:hypothetical protein